MTDLVNVVVPILVVGFVALVVGVAVFQGIPQPDATPAATIPPPDTDDSKQQGIAIQEVTNATSPPDSDR